jgi:dTDP-4-amino-4,6-dideoxy-D-galactose acyltransferase
MIRPLEWDSNFFGIKTGRLDTENRTTAEIISQLKSFKKSTFQLIYVFTLHNEAGPGKEIIKAGGRLVDEKVTYSMNISGFVPPLSVFIRSCMGAEMDRDLESLAIESGKYSRFRTDGQIPRKKFEELYRLWMKNSLNGTFAKEVFSYEEDGKKLGMVSIDIRQGEGWIGIIAVNEAFRGRSIGKNLIHAAVGFCRDNNVSILNVQTQAENKVSCSFYERIGFRIRNVEDVYHVWNVRD